MQRQLEAKQKRLSVGTCTLSPSEIQRIYTVRRQKKCINQSEDDEIKYFLEITDVREAVSKNISEFQKVLHIPLSYQLSPPSLSVL